MLEHTDAQIGRLVEFLKSVGQWDNTLFIVHVRQRRQPGGRPVRRAPRDEVLQRHPRERRRGGAAPGRHRRAQQPLQLPLGLGPGRQHAAQVVQAEHPRRRRARSADHALAGGASAAAARPAPSSATSSTSPRPSSTCWASRRPSVVAGVPQMPVHGVSLTPTFADADARRCDRGPQYFEMLGHRGIWKDGWKAVTHHDAGHVLRRRPLGTLPPRPTTSPSTTTWPSAEPAKLKEMIDLWWRGGRSPRRAAARRPRRHGAFRAPRMRPGLPSSRNRFIYYPPVSHIVSDGCPSAARGWTTSVTLDHPAGPADGALVARGSLNSGFALYREERPAGVRLQRVPPPYAAGARGRWRLAPRHRVWPWSATATAAGAASLRVDGEAVGPARSRACCSSSPRPAWISAAACRR